MSNYNDTRIAKLRTYLFTIVDDLLNTSDYQINANMLGIKVNDFSLDKIPTESVVERWVTGLEIRKDIYSFRSRKAYSEDTLNNLQNIGFFEDFENIINSNNKEGILPNIEGIESIECLNCGSLVNMNTNTAEFDIQIQITYKK